MSPPLSSNVRHRLIEKEDTMAFMKESVKSLKWYFIIVALLGGYNTLYYFANSQGNIILIISCIIAALFSIAWFYIGISLDKLIIKSSSMIIKVLLLSGVYLTLTCLLSLNIIGLVGGLLITWYLFKNIKRLSLEQRTS